MNAPTDQLSSLEQARDEALGYLSMTTCPYFDHEGTCDRGCYSEPACITDAPMDGWVGAAIKTLESTLVSGEDGTA